jgi:hypothetical protein
MPVSTELPALISTSALSVAIIQWMKNSSLPFLKPFSQQSSGLNRTVAWVAALIAGVGIHYHYDSALGALTITGLTGPAIVSAAINAAKSYSFNWLIYNTAIKGRTTVGQQPEVPVPPTPVEAPAQKG